MDKFFKSFQGHRTNVKLGTMHHRGLGMFRKGTHSSPGELASSLAKGFAHGPLSLHPWKREGTVSETLG